MTDLNFVAIDFETANKERTSACSLGIVTVENGDIVDRQHYLIKPTPNYYGSVQRAIHGMSSIDTDGEPTFGELWPQIQHLLDGKCVVSHNTAFDIGVLNALFDHYKLPKPSFDIVCTVMLAKYVLKTTSTSLDSVAKTLDVELCQHHNALCDAEVSANILIKIIQKQNCLNLPKLLDDADMQIGHYSARKYVTCKKKDRSPWGSEISINIHTNDIDKPQSLNRRDKMSKFYSDRKIDSSLLVKNLDTAEQGTIFYDKAVLITGVFQSIDRQSLAKRLQELGADINTAISSKTNYVVMGDGPGPAKVQKIKDLQDKGHEITIVKEAELLEIIKH